MKCINKLFLLILSVIPVFFFAGCKGKEIPFAYERNSDLSTLNISNSSSLYLESDTFAKNLCIDDGNYKNIELTGSYAAGVFDITDNSVIYGKNMYEEMTPASITKLLTALVALKHCDMNQVLTFTKECEVNEHGAQKLGLEAGDSMTMEQALNILLLFSANDVANMIAENYEGGKVEFIRVMNEEAGKLGATHTHFVNPHGLTEESHASCVYDLYLILNELSKNEKFLKIVSQNGYTTSYNKADGSIKTVEFSSTNMFINGTREVPEGYTVIGGKTGTTEAAGKCLIIYYKDSNDKPYIACILKSDDYDTLYGDMSTLISSSK
ncbi:MAG: D-alanyl-D-alanine carboxypeptidase [Lachnospiraceae bacterium]|nr:D-alanyl-D-alanine carboxypeptidase [Lachnospiraceae bacterium]